MCDQQVVIFGKEKSMSRNNISDKSGTSAFIKCTPLRGLDPELPAVLGRHACRDDGSFDQAMAEHAI